MTPRWLGPLDRAELEGFECRTYRHPETELVEEMVRSLSHYIDAGTFHGVGEFDGERLIGVAAWTFEQGPLLVARCAVVAVRNGYRNQGVGRRLKEAVINHARLMGAAAVISHVHVDNDAMSDLNISLGATLTPDPPSHFRCVIKLD